MFKKLTDTVETINKNINNIDQKVNQRLDAIEQRLETVDQRLDVVEQRLDIMDQKIDALDKKIDSVDYALDAEIDKVYKIALENKQSIEILFFEKYKSCFFLETIGQKKKNLYLRYKVLKKSTDIIYK